MVASRTIFLTEDVREGLRLGRHVEHDARSAEYAVPVDLTRPLKTTYHERKIGILDQGQLGSCTGNAGTGLLGTEPFFSSLPQAITAQLDEGFAVRLYGDATVVDGYPGTYPPDDTGSSGLAIGRVLKARGTIKSYRHAFGLLHALHTFQLRPGIIGIPWYESFDEPGGNGLISIKPGAQVRGGHELEVTAIEVLNGDSNNPQGALVIANSWSTSWGESGYCRMSFADFGVCLANQGDVMTFGVAA